jgi:hypothetical protein
MWFCCIYYLIFINLWINYRCTDLRMIYIITSNQPLTFHIIKIGRLWNRPQKNTFFWQMDSFPITNIPSSPSMTKWQLQPFYVSSCAQALLIDRYMIPKIQCISNTSWCRKTIFSGTPGYQSILYRCGFSSPPISWVFINHSSRFQTLHKTINYRMVYFHFPCHPSIAKTCLWHANSLSPLC